jgi:hypothetical protein
VFFHPFYPIEFIFILIYENGSYKDYQNAFICSLSGKLRRSGSDHLLGKSP